ncbi:hypothetical protein AHIS1_p061 [Acaryochloris phage A-HIS1]|nr:hypothetical protein AHIS1_p061 [Acaryochloris phage A-HIS1]
MKIKAENKFTQFEVSQFGGPPFLTDPGVDIVMHSDYTYKTVAVNGSPNVLAIFLAGNDAEISFLQYHDPSKNAWYDIPSGQFTNYVRKATNSVTYRIKPPENETINARDPQVVVPDGCAWDITPSGVIEVIDNRPVDPPTIGELIDAIGINKLVANLSVYAIEQSSLYSGDPKLSKDYAIRESWLQISAKLLEAARFTDVYLRDIARNT